MKAQHALGLNLSWSRVVMVFLIDVTVLVSASHWPGDPRQASYVWWTGVGVAVLVTIVALVAYHRVPLTSALAARVLDRFADPEKMLARGRTPAVDHRRRYGRDTVGIRESHNQLVALIEVAGRPVMPLGRHSRGAAAPVGLPVQVVAAALRQFDVRLAGIDIVSVGAAGTGSVHEHTTAADAETVVEHSTPGHRRTWLVLRMDPQANVAAVATRDSVAATLAAATERLAHDLNGRDIIARVLAADEFDAVDTAVLADLPDPRQKDPRRYVTSFWVSPRDIASENLDRLWLSDVDATVVTVRLSPRQDRVAVSALVRYHSGTRLHKDLRSEVNRFIGRRLTVVCESLPVPTRRPALVVPAREMQDPDDLTVSLDPAEEQQVVRVGAQP